MSRIDLDVKNLGQAFLQWSPAILTVFPTVSREVSFEYTKIVYRVPSVKRCARAGHLMNSNVKEEKGVKNRVELRYNEKRDIGHWEVSGEKVVEKCH